MYETPADAPLRLPFLREERHGRDVLGEPLEVSEVAAGGSSPAPSPAGMGTLQRSWHPEFASELALGCLSSFDGASEEHRQRFRETIEDWIGLGLHPNIRACFDLELDGLPRVIAERVAGDSLEDWVQSGRLYRGSVKPLERILALGLQLARALAYAHGRDVVHGDVRPIHCLLDDEGLQLKLTHFGLGRLQAALAQTAGAAPTSASDSYGLAASIVELFAGGLRGFEPDLTGVLRRLIEAGSPRPDIPRLPDRIAALLERCLDPVASARPDLRRVVRELEAAYVEVIGRAVPPAPASEGSLLAGGLNNRARILALSGRREQAQALLAQAVEADPGHVEAAFNGNVLRWLQGEIDDAGFVASTEGLCATHGGSWRTRYLLALAMLARGDLDGALRVLEETLGIPGERPEVAGALALARSGELAHAGCIRSLVGHAGPVRSVALALDVRHGLSGSEDGGLLLWELDTGACVTLLNGHAGTVRSVALAADGQHALSGGDDGELRVWDLESATSLRVLAREPVVVRSVALSADGQHALAGGEDGALRLWNPETGIFRRLLHGHRRPVTSVALSADGRQALSGGEDGALRLWDTDSGVSLRTFEGHVQPVTSVALSADGARGLSGSEDGTLRLWATDGSSGPRTFSGHAQPVTSVALSADGSRALSGSLDGTLRLWDTDSRTCLRTLAGHALPVTSVALSADGHHALSGSEDGTLRYWRLPEGPRWDSLMQAAGPREHAELEAARVRVESHVAESREAECEGRLGDALAAARAARAEPALTLSTLADERWRELDRRCRRVGLRAAWQAAVLTVELDEPGAVAVSADGRYGLSGSWRGTIRLWDPECDSCVEVPEAHDGPVWSAALSADGCHALTGGGDGTLRLWDIERRTRLRLLTGHSGEVRSVAISADGLRALSGGQDGTLRLWDLATGACLRVLGGHSDGVRSVAFAADGRHALSGGWDGTLRLWDTLGNDCLRVLTGHTGAVFSVALSADGRRAISGGWDRTLRLWDVERATCLRVLTGASSWVTCVALSPDERFSVSGCRDGALHVWDLESGQCLHTLAGHDRPVESLGLSADGLRAISGGRDGTVRLWQFDWELAAPDPADWDEAARPHLQHFLSLHTPFAGALPAGREPTPEDVRLALTRAGSPRWTTGDFDNLIRGLQRAGLGWLRSDRVSSELERMAAGWTGPPPLFG